MIEYLDLTWEQFDEAVASVPAIAQGAAGVYGVPRGGLMLAVAISHRYGLPLLAAPCPGCLIVDDIFETGSTLAPHRGHDVWVWVTKTHNAWCGWLLPVEPSCWVRFPWENNSTTTEDVNAYYASRQ